MRSAPARLRIELLIALLVWWAAIGCGIDRSSGPNVVIVLIDELRKDAADQHMTGVNAAARGQEDGFSLGEGQSAFVCVLRGDSGREDGRGGSR